MTVVGWSIEGTEELVRKEPADRSHTTLKRSAPTCLVQTAWCYRENFIKRRVHVHFGRITLRIRLKID